MVNPDLVAAAQKLSSRRILVTGGSGFVGPHLARALRAGGHDVTACGRNPYRTPLPPDGVSFKRGDLTDAARMHELCQKQDLVFHTGALSAPWGNDAAFQAINVGGTQNVVDACRAAGVARLVHVSSTAVHFDFVDALNLTESTPLAVPLSSSYAKSKADAEAIVRQAYHDGLDVVTVRARAVFGPGDNSLLPRILAAADEGRLRRIGDGQCQMDLTYIDNLVLGLILAAETGVNGRTYTITNDEPVLLWDFVENVLQRTGRQAKLKSIPRSIALGAATTAEYWHRWRGKPGEPAITRYALGLLSTSKTFDISAARGELQYHPLINMEEATRRTIDALTTRDELQSEVAVGLQLFSTGYTTAKAHHVEHGGNSSLFIKLHATFALINHPQHGLTLFDTGYSPRFFAATQSWPYCLYRQATPVVTNERTTATAQLRDIGIAPADIQRIVVSHFHADHICGLRDFPNADIIASGPGWRNLVRGKAGGKSNSRLVSGLRALRKGFLPELLPPDFEERLFLVDHFHDPGIGPFARSHDLFADSSVRLVDLSGHAPGQWGALVQRGTDDRVLLAADAAWTSRTIREGLRPTLPFRLFADSVKDLIATQQRLHQLHQSHGDIEIALTHCPEVAERYGFNETLHSLLGVGESA